MELARAVPRGDAPGGRGSPLSAGVLKLKRGPWEPDAQRAFRRTTWGSWCSTALSVAASWCPSGVAAWSCSGRATCSVPGRTRPRRSSSLSWTVIEPAAIAVLDEPLAARAREVPQLLEALTERALRRSRRLAVSAAIANTVGVEERLLLSLWQLTELWGRKASEGAVLPFRLSHQTLADLVGARRPTVTLALRNLTQQGKLRRERVGAVDPARDRTVGVWPAAGIPVAPGRLLTLPAAPEEASQAPGPRIRPEGGRRALRRRQRGCLG